MAESTITFTVFRGSATMGRFQADVDPDNASDLAGLLRGWLEAEKWGKGMWPGFTMAFSHPRSGRRTEVRP